MLDDIKSNFKTEIHLLLINLVRTAKISWRIDRRNTLSYVAAMLTQVITSIAALYFAGRVLTELFGVVANNSPTQPLVLNFVLSAVLLALEQVAWRLMSYYQECSLIAWQTQLSPEFAKKVSSLDISRFENPEFAKLINKVSQEHSWKPANFIYFGLNVIHGTTRVIGAAIVLLAFSPKIVFIISLALIPSVVVEARQSKVKWGVWHLKGDASRRYWRINQLIQNKQDIMDLRVFGMVDYLVGYSRRLLNDFNQGQRDTLKSFIRPAVGVRLTEGLVVGGINLWLIMRVVKGVLEVGQYTFYSGMVSQFNNSLGLVFSGLGNLYDHSLFMTDYFKFMDTPGLNTSPGKRIRLKDKAPKIVFDNVTFKYPQGGKPVFKNLSLTIEPGESIALVGENGAGKSTLIKLLLRFYDVSEGAIYVNGIDIKDIDTDSWYRQVSALMQDFTRYPFPIEDNIYFGRVTARRSRPKMLKAAQMGGVTEFAGEYSQGMKTMLDASFEDGVEPSGGQWQRVALARAFYRNANLLILDEPTAAIDANAEYEIFRNINESRKNKTTIIVSHRFSTVRTADHIYVVENGQIQEHGTHAELLSENGRYARMFTKQATGYK